MLSLLTRVHTKRSLLIFVFFLISFIRLSLALAAEEKVKVEIEGVGEEIMENIRAYLSLEKPPSRPTETMVRRLYNQAPEEIKQALQAMGYYQPRIDSELLQDDKKWIARFKIDPGPPVRLTRLDLTLTGEGSEDSEFQRLLENLPLREGEVLHHGRYEQAKELLENLAAERGYFDARFTTHRLELNLQQNEASAQLDFDTGPRYRLGVVRFRQNGETFDLRFLDRFVPFEPGEPFHADQILALNSLLVNSGYFSRVDVRPIREEAEELTLPIEATAIARKKYELSVGLGYGTDTGLRAILGWDNHRINEWGHRFRSELELSILRQSLTTNYQIPLQQPATDRLEFQAGVQQEDTETAESRLGQVGVSRSVLRWKEWIETLFLNYRTETYEVGEQRGHSRLILPGVTYTRTLTDRAASSRRGSTISFTIQGTDEVIGSDMHLLQSRIDGKIIRPIAKPGRILLRLNLGWTWVSNFEELPATLRFFAGGDRSVRGYTYNSLGPVDETGDVIGGRYLAVGSAEYDYRFAKNWSIAFFYDVGNAFNEIDEMNPQQGVGVGGRWYSPVGPVRVDLAYALDQPGFAIRFHINMGPDL